MEIYRNMPALYCNIYIYTTSNLPKRFSNHKSHIKKAIRSCKLVNHFIDVDHSLDFCTTESFNRTLSAHLSVIIVDTVDFASSVSKVEREKAMEAREGFFQTQLKTLERFGGMNTLDSNHNTFKSALSWFLSFISYLVKFQILIISDFLFIDF